MEAEMKNIFKAEVNVDLVLCNSLEGYTVIDILQKSDKNDDCTYTQWMSYKTHTKALASYSFVTQLTLNKINAICTDTTINGQY